jgi:hypothetical protein
MRWKIRTWMLVIVAAAAIVAYGLRFTRLDARSLSFQRQAINELQRVRTLQNTQDGLENEARQEEKSRAVDRDRVARLRTDARLALRFEWHHRVLVERYSFASRHPWLPVLPDWWGVDLIF